MTHKISRRTALAGGTAFAFGASGAFAQTPANTIKIAAPFEINGFDPVRSGFLFGRLEIAETLVTADDGGRPVPALATSWTVSDDGVLWRFNLRKGALFHDGSPVTATAVADALNRTRGIAASVLANAPIAAVGTDGEGTVTIRTTRPFQSLLAFLSHSSGIILSPSSFEGNTAVRAIGSGPYRATLVEAPLRIEAEFWSGWVGAKPAFTRISYLAVPRGETRTIMAESGQADLVYVLPPESVERLRRSARIAVEVVPIARTRAIKFNAARPAFADVRTRQAFSLAIDREGIAKALLRSPRSQASQLFPPALADWHQPGLAPLAHDPARARALLAEAGWAPGADGIVIKDGQPFRVTLRTFSDRAEQPPMAAAIQAQVREIGIDMQVSIVNSGEIPAGHRDGTMDLALFARNFALTPDPLGTLLQDFGVNGGDWGAMNWTNPELVTVLGRLGSETDGTARSGLRRRVSEILHTEMPVAPIAWFDHGVAVNRRLAGVTIDPFELSYRVSAMRPVA
ncbi:MAG: ABC transporter substrate-binding protein [Beijerinckiaceae bacterium]